MILCVIKFNVLNTLIFGTYFVLFRARKQHLLSLRYEQCVDLLVDLLKGLAMLGILHIVKQLGIRIRRFFKRSEDESLFLYQVGLQYAKTILLLKVRQHNFNSHGDPYMSSLTMPATHSKVRHTIPVTKCLNHWVC